MNIGIIGYGRMGKTIEGICKERGHNVEAIIDLDNHDKIYNLSPEEIDVAIEFTQPQSAFENITTILSRGIPVVSGTTGWIEQMDAVKLFVEQYDTGFFYAPNYSIGVNLFFAIAEYAGRLMNKFPEFDIHIEEIHHVHKLDSPSGTAIHLAQGLIDRIQRKKSWINEPGSHPEELEILSDRQPNVPGIHSAIFTGPHDIIELKHTASSRLGFATGAVLAAEFLHGKKGIYNMKNLLDAIYAT
ncbi:MAG TPA: 4-hydroxy-tetrahydrodipicolinate reductase [Membranihabitans sp.]|nr:4-hydroxy-tetrahydrodipicolinate reductase [Membranihabitans sp.]